jgi:osmotically-inducible protein OsmY
MKSNNFNFKYISKSAIIFSALNVMLAGHLLAKEPQHPYDETRGVQIKNKSLRENYRADKTIQNSISKINNGLTTFDQSESAGDLKLTQRLRQILVQNNELSTDAKNVKIITRKGVMTLKGTVETMEEMQFIVNSAMNMRAIKRVDNEILVDSGYGK